MDFGPMGPHGGHDVVIGPAMPPAAGGVPAGIMIPANRPIQTTTEASSLERLTADDEDTTTLNLTKIRKRDLPTISRALGQTTHLRSLDVAVNRSSLERIRALVPSIRSVANLRTLRLYYQSGFMYELAHGAVVGNNACLLLKRINPHVRTLRLERVTCTDTFVKPFRRALVSLQVLQLHDCFYDENILASARLQEKIGLVLSGSRIRELGLECMYSEPLIRAMTNHPTLTKLSLDHVHRFSAMAVRDVLDSTNTKLERLELVECRLEKANFYPIIQGLITNRTVQALVIRRSSIAADATELLPTLLQSNNTTLTHLELTDQAIGCSSAAYNAILVAAMRNTVLTTLILKGFSVRYKPLAEFVARNRSVTNFSMGQSIDTRNFYMLHGGMRRLNYRTLTKLDLSGCGLHDMHLVDVALGLVHSAVTVLNLAENHITNASPLANCTTLKEIDLTQNDIGNDGAVQLSTMAPRLECLNLNCCQIGVRGFRSLLTAPFRTLSCYLLELAEEPLEEDQELSQALIELLPTATLRSLAMSVGSDRTVRDIEFTKEHEWQILHALAKNKSLVAFDDYKTWFKTSSSRRTVQHVCLRNSVAFYSTALVPVAFASLLNKSSSGAALVYRMLRDRPDWITSHVVGRQQPEEEQQSEQLSAVSEQQPVVHKRRRMNPPPPSA
jgi:Leucine Rich repeat